MIVDNKNSLKLVQNLAKAQLLESPHQHVGGPISIDLLATCCRAALLENCELLWLDRLCIMLTSRNDKN